MKTKAAVKNQSRKHHTWGQNHAAGKLPPGNNPVLATPDPSIINPAAQFGFFGPLESPNQPTRRGRPTLNDNELRGRRDELAYVFESYWAEIGWQLGCARKPEDIQKAFEPLRGKYGEDRVKFLLRPTSQPATSSLIRTTGKALSKALEEERSAQTAYDSQVEKCQEAKAAVYEGSPEHRLSLKKEVTFRLKNIRQLEKERTLKEKILRKAESELHKAEVASQQSTGADFAKRQVEYQDTKAAYETAKATCETEKKILRATKERLAAASPERWALAKEEAQRRQAELEKLEALLATASVLSLKYVYRTGQRNRGSGRQF